MLAKKSLIQSWLLPKNSSHGHWWQTTLANQFHTMVGLVTVKMKWFTISCFRLNCLTTSIRSSADCQRQAIISGIFRIFCSRIVLRDGVLLWGLSFDFQWTLSCSLGCCVCQRPAGPQGGHSDWLMSPARQRYGKLLRRWCRSSLPGDRAHATLLGSFANPFGFGHYARGTVLSSAGASTVPSVGDTSNASLCIPSHTFS